MKTFTIKGFVNGVLMAEECGVEESEVQYLVDELEEEGFVCEVVKES